MIESKNGNVEILNLLLIIEVYADSKDEVIIESIIDI